MHSISHTAHDGLGGLRCSKSPGERAIYQPCLNSQGKLEMIFEQILNLPAKFVAGVKGRSSSLIILHAVASTREWGREVRDNEATWKQDQITKFLSGTCKKFGFYPVGNGEPSKIFS